MKTNLTAHMIVRNEEQWIWYGINSVLGYVTKLIIYDTGSTDQTVSIIATIKSDKITFVQKGKVTPDQLVALRNEQIAQTRTEWFLLVDGDEVWPRNTIEELTKLLPSLVPSVMGIVVPAHVPIGDLYHYQSDRAGRYALLDKIGHYNIRAYRKHKDYQWEGTYPLEAYVDAKHIQIQQVNKKLHLLKNKYWHLTHLRRSSRDDHHKRKLELGHAYSGKLPEVFLQRNPALVPSPCIRYSFFEWCSACLITPALWIKRLFI